MQFSFLQVTDINNASNYLPIGLQLIFAMGLIAVIMLGSNYLGPKRKTADKLQNFESGIVIKGNARQPFAIKYFLVAILFVLFDQIQIMSQYLRLYLRVLRHIWK